MSSTPSGGFGQETDNVAKYQHGGVQARLLARFRRRLLSEASGLAPARVLDAGCGEGMVSSWLRGVLPSAEITGVDGRPEAVAAYRAANPSLHAREGDLDALPFEDGAFDLVVCTEVLEHIPDAPRTLRELTRVLERPPAAHRAARAVLPRRQLRRRPLSRPLGLDPGSRAPLGPARVPPDGRRPRPSRSGGSA